MTKIDIWDCDAEQIEKVADANDVRPAEVIEVLMDYIDDVKEAYGWQ